jgi:hypothetical protein
MLICEPIGIGSGRGAWNMFVAGTEFLGTLRSSGALGIAISVYIFDGCLFSCLSKHFHARHEVFYDRNLGFDHGVLHEALRCMDWVVPVKCIAHGCSNAVAWGLKEVGLEAVRDDVHVAVASLINCRTVLHAAIDNFLVTYLKFSSDRSASISELQSFWKALHVEPNMCDRLSEMDLHWSGTHLVVNSDFENEASFNDVANSVLYLLTWCKFSDTRWAKVGACARKWIGSLAVGIDKIWAMAIADPHVSNYHLSGYSKASPDVRLLLAVAAFSSLPGESLLIDLFEDDRFLMNTNRLWGIVAEEVDYLESVVPMFVWDRVVALAKLGVDGAGFRSKVIKVAHVTVGYL